MPSTSGRPNCGVDRRQVRLGYCADSRTAANGGGGAGNGGYEELVAAEIKGGLSNAAAHQKVQKAHPAVYAAFVAELGAQTRPQ